MKKFWINLAEKFSDGIGTVFCIIAGIFMLLSILIPCLFSKEWRKDFNSFLNFD